MQREFVSLGIECSKGHRIGLVYRSLIDDGSTPYKLAKGAAFVDPNPADPASGKVRGRCAICGADAQIRWERVRDALERLVVEGKTSGTIREHPGD